METLFGAADNFATGYDLLESEEEGAGPGDEEEGQVEDALLPGHHHPSVAAESIFPRELLPFSHLSCYHHRRHGVLFSDQQCALLWVNTSIYTAKGFRQYADGSGGDLRTCSPFPKYYLVKNSPVNE